MHQSGTHGHGTPASWPDARPVGLCMYMARPNFNCCGYPIAMISILPISAATPVVMLSVHPVNMQLVVPDIVLRLHMKTRIITHMVTRAL